MLEEYQDYMYRLCKELECRIEQEGKSNLAAIRYRGKHRAKHLLNFHYFSVCFKAYYWATDIRKRALIELNYTYVPAPTTKAAGEKTNKGDEFMLNPKSDKP
ncbi:uncharacterized protein DEA37_0003335, partial [Paragonimus westermani]